VSRRELHLKTRRRSEVVELTGLIREELAASGVTAGLLQVFVPHPRRRLTVNEHNDPKVMADLMAHLDRLVPGTGLGRTP